MVTYYGTGGFTKDLIEFKEGFPAGEEPLPLTGIAHRLDSPAP